MTPLPRETPQTLVPQEEKHWSLLYLLRTFKIATPWACTSSVSIFPPDPCHLPSHSINHSFITCTVPEPVRMRVPQGGRLPGRLGAVSQASEDRLAQDRPSKYASHGAVPKASCHPCKDFSKWFGLPCVLFLSWVSLTYIEICLDTVSVPSAYIQVTLPVTWAPSEQKVLLPRSTPNSHSSGCHTFPESRVPHLETKAANTRNPSTPGPPLGGFDSGEKDSIEQMLWDTQTCQAVKSSRMFCAGNQGNRLVSVGQRQGSQLRQ